MRVVVTTESRYQRTPDGAMWTLYGPARPFWDRYLAAFDEVRVVARVFDVAEPTDGALRVDGGAVRVWPIPYYVGPLGHLRRWPAIRRAAGSAAADTDAV